MKRSLAAVLLVMACVPPAPATLEEWCSEQMPDRCVEAVLVLEGAAELEDCILTSLPDRPLASQCQSTPPNTNTTIPRPGELTAARDLDGIETRVAELLTEARPQGDLTVGVVFAQDLSVTQVEDLLASFDAIWISAWRSDYACLMVGGEARASRFAFPDGVERAAAARVAADAGGTAITGRFLLEAIWEEMEEAARALRSPGVLIEAVQTGIPLETLPELTRHELVKVTRLALDPESAGDLREAKLPDDCISF